MAKDPNYNRYAGMTSLPGDPLNPRKPRPYRVDEDGIQIFQDESPDYVNLAGEDEARRRGRAGILDWDEIDRGIQGRLSGLSAPNADPLVSQGSLPDLTAGQRQKLTLDRKRIGDTDYHVISASTYDPTRSNGKTALPSADVIADMKANMHQIAVTDGGPEKGTRLVHLPLGSAAQPDNRPTGERRLPLTNPEAEMSYFVPALGAKAKSIGNADTLNITRLPGTVAFGHGHRDGISDGMIDEWDPGNNLYGDIESLLSNPPLPMATVSEGRIGWHQLDNGRVQFMYPVDSYSPEQKDEEDRMRVRIQKNLDRQQSRFQRKIR